MTNKITYEPSHETFVLNGHTWEHHDIDRTCENCRYWCYDSAGTGWAICTFLAYAEFGLKLAPRVEIEKGTAGIVKTYHVFGCGYWEGAE